MADKTHRAKIRKAHRAHCAVCGGKIFLHPKNGWTHSSFEMSPGPRHKAHPVEA